MYVKRCERRAHTAYVYNGYESHCVKNISKNDVSNFPTKSLCQRRAGVGKGRRMSNDVWWGPGPVTDGSRLGWGVLLIKHETFQSLINGGGGGG